MLTSTEIRKKLFGNADLFMSLMEDKEHIRAALLYKDTVSFAVNVELEEEDMIRLFGTRQTDPPVIGLFPEHLVMKAYEAYIFQVSETERAERERQQIGHIEREERDRLKEMLNRHKKYRR